MNWLIFLLGLVVGSFLNVVIFRYNTGVAGGGWRTFAGRSACLACGHRLAWFELLPVASFLLQRGRCRACGAGVSWQYPLVELLTGGLFLAVWQLGLPLPLTLLHWLAWSLLVVIVVYDLRHLIIPDGLAFWFGVTALGVSLSRIILDNKFSWPDLVPDFAFGLALAAAFWLLWRFSRGRWLGLGDAKLVLGLGWLAGWPTGLAAIALAFWSGAAVGLGLILLGRLSPRAKSFTMKSELPFAPFLVLGFALATLFGFNALPF